MTENKTSILLSDVSVEGDVVEKDKIILDAKISGNIKAGEVIRTHLEADIVNDTKNTINPYRIFDIFFTKES